jgi:nucleoside-diphosphate-sugar epimerase
MRRVLIAGCGYLGQATAALFQHAGWHVVGWTRSSESARALSAKSYPVEPVDISKADRVSSYPQEFDAVIQCASTTGGNVESYRRTYLIGAHNLMDRFPGANVLFTGSTSVYAQKRGELVTEESAAEPQHETGNILRQAEQLVLDRRGMVARLAGLYGPGRSFLLSRFLKGEAFIDPSADRFVNQIHRDDAARALLFLLDEHVPRPGIYNVVDDQPILQSECYRWLADKLQRPVPPMRRSTLKRKRGDSNKRVSNAKLRRLGWLPRYPSFAEGMEESVLPSASW